MEKVWHSKLWALERRQAESTGASTMFGPADDETHRLATATAVDQACLGYRVSRWDPEFDEVPSEVPISWFFDTYRTARSALRSSGDSRKAHGDDRDPHGNPKKKEGRED